LPAEPASLLIAAVSGRALAQAARRAGLIPLVTDFFADLDTQQAAHGWRKLSGLKRGFQAKSLLRALDDLAKDAPSPILGFAYGAGFEDRPELLDLIAARWPVLGNDAATVKRIKAPEIFFAELARLGISHPKTALQSPTKGAGWLAKKVGGAGGSHVLPSQLAHRSSGVYFQRSASASNGRHLRPGASGATGARCARQSFRRSSRAP
jgi:predicted ATP-grasp superfamily ATP-dependent carboligase